MKTELIIFNIISCTVEQTIAADISQNTAAVNDSMLNAAINDKRI